MKKNYFTLVFLMIFSYSAFSQLTPEITSWIINPGGEIGYNSIPSNVQTVQYSTGNVYVSCTCIPGYDIGPWTGNPNTPANQNFVFKITRNPQQNTGAGTNVGLGHIGVWSNGVSIFNVSDGMSYNNSGVWNRNAYYWEGPSFDECLGHPQQTGEYHHHVSPKCLYDVTDSTVHSPIIGYAFDGFPVYGAYGYTNTNGTGAIKRMRSSYVVSSATTRANGPAVGPGYPAGCFIEDHVYNAGSGDLDQRNGRFCVTPDYPNGIYAYFVTIGDDLLPVFPYTFYGTYYGVVQAGNTGPGSGHVTITEPTTVYTPVATGNNEPEREMKFQVMPNPVEDYAFIQFDPQSAHNVNGSIYSQTGQLLKTFVNLQPATNYAIDFTPHPAGIYFLHLNSGKENTVVRLIKLR